MGDLVGSRERVRGRERDAMEARLEEVSARVAEKERRRKERRRRENREGLQLGRPPGRKLPGGRG